MQFFQISDSCSKRILNFQIVCLAFKTWPAERHQLWNYRNVDILEKKGLFSPHTPHLSRLCSVLPHNLSSVGVRGLFFRRGWILGQPLCISQPW